VGTRFKIRRLAVDGEADGREAAGGGMDLLPARHHGGDDACQVGGAHEGLRGATGDDGYRGIRTCAEGAGRAPAAVRARLEKEDGLERITAGIQREKTMTLLIDNAAIVNG